jgi:hypothetical protein
MYARRSRAPLFAGAVLASIGVADAAILDFGIYTADTDTGLYWLDVTVTSGMSFDQVSPQLGPGGQLDGWRYATAADFDQLMIGFGFLPGEEGCLQSTSFSCNFGSVDDGRVEYAIRMLGDTLDRRLDGLPIPISSILDGESPGFEDIDPDGAGYTFGLLADDWPDGGRTLALIWDEETVIRSAGESFRDDPDQLWTRYNAIDSFSGGGGVFGSFLVANTLPEPLFISAVVPIPAAAWLFASALGGLAWLHRR